MAENCHLKKNHRHGRELPFEKKFISAWPRTAIGKKFHIGMAENCHLKKNHIGMAENCHRKKISYRHGRELPLHTRTVAKTHNLTCILQHLNSKKVAHSKILILNVL